MIMTIFGLDEGGAACTADRRLGRRRRPRRMLGRGQARQVTTFTLVPTIPINSELAGVTVEPPGHTVYVADDTTDAPTRNMHEVTAAGAR